MVTTLSIRYCCLLELNLELVKTSLMRFGFTTPSH